MKFKHKFVSERNWIAVKVSKALKSKNYYNECYNDVMALLDIPDYRALLKYEIR